MGMGTEQGRGKSGFPNEPSIVPAARGLVSGSAALQAVSKLLSPAQSGQETASLPLSPPGWSHLGLELRVVALSVYPASD